MARLLSASLLSGSRPSTESETFFAVSSSPVWLSKPATSLLMPLRAGAGMSSDSGETRTAAAAPRRSCMMAFFCSGLGAVSMSLAMPSTIFLTFSLAGEGGAEGSAAASGLLHLSHMAVKAPTTPSSSVRKTGWGFSSAVEPALGSSLGFCGAGSAGFLSSLAAAGEAGFSGLGSAARAHNGASPRIKARNDNSRRVLVFINASMRTQGLRSWDVLGLLYP